MNVNVGVAILAAGFTFFLGFLIGWLVEWRIDLGYWHSYFEDETEAGPEKVMIVPPASAAPAQLPPAEDSLLVTTLREQLTEREADLDALRADIASRERDWREREAQLRETGERQTLTMIEQLNANEAQWRETAAARESELSEEVRRLRAQVDELQAAKADADAEWRHELARREQQWQESKEAEAAALNGEIQQLRAQLADVHARFARYQTSHPDDLAAITGIGPKIQDDLRRAGITSYAELAKRTPDDLRAVLNPPKWRKLDFEEWIVQARQLAEADSR